MNRREAETLLRAAVGNPDARFREGQWEAIDAIANHRQKILVVQRTGWGKMKRMCRTYSLCWRRSMV